MRARRAALGVAEQRACAQAACARILALPAYRAARVVMAYAAARGELSLLPVLEDVIASGRVLALPRCEGRGVMRAYRVRGEGDLIPGAYGILEPGPDCPQVCAQEIDMILVPGAAFDRTGMRVGQGGGYYDRFLPDTRAVRVGVCHDFALLGAGEIQAQAHDVWMDAVATPQEVVTVARCAAPRDGMAPACGVQAGTCGGREAKKA